MLFCSISFCRQNRDRSDLIQYVPIHVNEYQQLLWTIHLDVSPSKIQLDEWFFIDISIDHWSTVGSERIKVIDIRFY